MNRTTRTVVVVAIATVLAAIGTFGVYVAVLRMPVREVEVAHRLVAVATQALPTGTLITEAHVKLAGWPASSVVPGSFSEVSAVVNRGLIASVVENEPLIESKLAPIGSGAGLVPIIPHGMRAVSVRVDDVIGVAGFVAHDTRVDVLVTVRGAGTASGEAQSRTVLSNVLVLTSGTRLDQQAAPESSVPSTVVTLAVAPGDAERIALASSEGRISLALRNPLDHETPTTTGIGVAELMRGSTPKPEPPPTPRPRPVQARRVAPPPPPEPEPEPEPPPVYQVETIRGAKRTVEILE
jgi:pilus assembly protein CpaB